MLFFLTLGKIQGEIEFTKKRICAILFKKGNLLFRRSLIIIASLLLIAGCKSNVKTNRNFPVGTLKPARITPYGVKVGGEKDTSGPVSATQKVTEDFIQSSFLNLDVQKNKNVLLALFTDEAAAQAGKNFDSLTLGSTAAKLDSIEEAKPKITNISIEFDKQQDPKLTNAAFVIEGLVYRAGATRIKGKVSGSLMMENQNGDYKIFDYQIKQAIKSQKGGG